MNNRRAAVRTRSRRPDESLLGVPRPLSRKQVQDMIRRKQSFFQLDLRGIDLSGLCFDGVDLRQAKLAEANLGRCSFRQANLAGASMWQANLQDAVLDQANLEETDLDMANLDGCTFRSARIRKTIFPNQQRALPVIEASVRTGARVNLPHALDGEDG